MKNKKLICIIILNYNTWKMTISLINNLLKILLPEGSQIVVVDNCSSNDSYQQLKKWNLFYHKIILLNSNNNNGYASGNNIGLKYAYRQGYQYAWILNNDILFPDNKILVKMLQFLIMHPDIAAVSPKVFTPQGYETSRSLYRPTIFSETIGFLMERYKDRGIHKDNGYKDYWTYTYRPQGCCFLVLLQKIYECNFFDEYTFLYCEEPILAERLSKVGGRCACLLTTQILHNHSQTISSNVKKKKQKEMLKRSNRYLWHHYYGWNYSTIIIIEKFSIINNIIINMIKFIIYIKAHIK